MTLGATLEMGQLTSTMCSLWLCILIDFMLTHPALPSFMGKGRKLAHSHSSCQSAKYVRFYLKINTLKSILILNKF